MALIAASLLFGIFALQMFSPEQFENENQQDMAQASAVTKALNAALAVTANPQATLDAFAESIESGDAIRFRKAAASADSPRIRLTTDGVPQWFISLLRIPNVASAYPVLIGQRRVGDILFVPDLSADLLEKWLGFLAIVLSGSVLLVLAALSAYLTTTLALRPLEQLGAGLARMQQGDYDSAIPLLGPPEVRKSCEKANQLALRLKHWPTTTEACCARSYRCRTMSAANSQRANNDQLGPLLFAIRANAIALSGYVTDAAASGAEAPSNQLLEAAEAVQHASRRILEGLSPLYLEELGLEKSIQTFASEATFHVADRRDSFSA